MKYFTILIRESYRDDKIKAHIYRVVEALEVAPAPGSHGGCLIRNRVEIYKKYFGVYTKLLGVNESMIFVDNVTLNQLKNKYDRTN